MDAGTDCKWVVRLPPCSTFFIQASDLSFKGLPEEAFEHLTSLNYLYLANNKVRVMECGGGRATLRWAGFPSLLVFSSLELCGCSQCLQPGLWVPVALDVEKGAHTAQYDLECV